MRDISKPFYSNELLEKIASLIRRWDEEYPVKTKLDSHIRHEFHLLLQTLMILQEPNPLAPSSAAIQDWFDLSRGLDVAPLRSEVLRRLRRFDASFAEFLGPVDGQHPRYPDLRHLLCWRRYARELYRRSRKHFAAASRENILESEENNALYYEATHRAHSHTPSTIDCFVDSHRVVADLFVKRWPPPALPPRVLEFGCGDGRLLLELRKRFPQGEFAATNVFDTRMVLPEVLSFTEVVHCPVEENPFQDSSFDLIVSTEVIEHLQRPRDMVREIHRLLKPGGTFVVTAPSVHTQFLNANPMTYAMGLISATLGKWVLPPFHNMYEPLTPLLLSHYAFSVQEFRRIFQPEFRKLEVGTTRFNHLRKFRLEGLAPKIPFLNRFGGLLIAAGAKS